MPSYNTHKNIGMIGALILGVIIYAYIRPKVILNWQQWLLLAGVVIFYSNLSDLDLAIGRLRKRTLFIIFTSMALMGVISFFINVWMMVGIFFVLGLLGIGLLQVKHRGPLHTYWFAILAASPLLLIHWLHFVLGLTCAFSHIFIDRLWSGLKRKVKHLFGIRDDNNTRLNVWCQKNE